MEIKYNSSKSSATIKLSWTEIRQFLSCMSAVEMVRASLRMVASIPDTVIQGVKSEMSEFFERAEKRGYKFRPTHRCDGDESPSNGERAERAARAVRAYVESDRPDVSHTQDFLCDLMHLADREKGDFEDVLERARSCYLEER